MISLTHNNITFVPCIPQRMAFADEVRRLMRELRPARVAVDLPSDLREWIIRGVLRLPQISILSYPAADDEERELLYFPIDPCDARIEAIRLALAAKIKLVWLGDASFDGGKERREIHHWDLPDDLMVERTDLETYVEAADPLIEGLGLVIDPDAGRRMAARLRQAASDGRPTLCVLGLGRHRGLRLELERMETEQEALEPQGVPASPPRKGSFLSHLAAGSIPGVLREIPYFVHRRELQRKEERNVPARFNKESALLEAYREAAKSYTERYKTEIGFPRFKALVQFTRNLALVDGRLQPDLYQAIIGSKSSVDGDYAHELRELLRAYPEQETDQQLPVLNLHRGRGTFSDREERFRMSALFDEPEMQWVKIPLRRRPPEELMELWKTQWGRSDWGICSWPPEDELQEKFMAFLRQRALQVLREDKRQVVEFSTSILDGLDIRETMRNWHTGKLFVQQMPQPQGEVGAVVLIFDERNDANYPWRCTLYAENQNESDISFYATPLGDQVVGPRICRTEFGGILSIFPAHHIPDIWSLPIRGISWAEMLLAGAILFSEKKFITYVADRPASTRMRQLATQHGRYLIHLPMQGFAQSQMKKVRNFHILNGRDVRNYAADYIF